MRTIPFLILGLLVFSQGLDAKVPKRVLPEEILVDKPTSPTDLENNEEPKPLIAEGMICAPGLWYLDEEKRCQRCTLDGLSHVGTGPLVDDNNPCAETLCDSTQGPKSRAIDATCELNDPCKNNFRCLEGVCVGDAKSCDDYSQCTKDSCTAGKGCMHEPLDGPCDDFNPYTGDDLCLNGRCVGILDTDKDGVQNHLPGNLPGDNCPLIANPDQLDSNQNGVGDACEKVRMWKQVLTDAPVVALTFDDGYNNAVTETLLAVLAKYDAKATFFLNSVYIEDNAIKAETLKIIYNAGHLLANHSYSHTLGASAAETVEQLKHGEQKMFELSGAKMAPWFRPPGFEHRDWLAESMLENGYTENVRCSLDPKDWAADKSTHHEVSSCVVDNAIAGDIILLHAGPKQTLLAIEDILKGLQDKGFFFVTLEELTAFGPVVEEDAETSRQCTAITDKAYGEEDEKDKKDEEVKEEDK